MLGWIMENIGTILITIVLAILVVLIVRSLVTVSYTHLTLPTILRV